MPQNLETIVQRMMDAGESEDNIAAVIREFPSTAPSEDKTPWLLGAGAAALGAGAYALTRNPQLAAKAGKTLMDARRASMLSGLALPKSILGAVGEAAGSSIERGSLRPLKEMLSMETLRDVGRTFKAGPNYAESGPATGIGKYNPFGRLMGAADTAAQNAFVRAGATPEEAARKMLQAPLGGGPLVKSLTNNPVADMLVPFRRTPMNQFAEGMESLRPSKAFASKGATARLATTLGLGAATGATAEDPKTIALGTAMAGTQGLPFAMAAGTARALSTGSKRKGAEAMQGLSPVPEYGLAEGTIGPAMSPTDPASWGLRPAAINASKYLRSLLGMD